MKYNFQDLKIWVRSKNLAKQVYVLTTQLPEIEKFGLTSQMRRAAVSVPSNIAEGSKRSTKKDFAQFLRIAQGSLAELETQTIIAEEIFSLKTGSIRSEIKEIQNMIHGLIAKL
jgi:four helix bundle protein